jgi:tetratricopeptide (TPR) repeat protein
MWLWWKGVLAIALIVLAVSGTGQVVARADIVRHTGGSITGKVVQADANQVVVDRGQGRQEVLEPHRVEMILFDDEPSTLRTAKMAAVAGRFEEVMSGLERVQLPENVDPKVKQEMDFLRAFCRTRLAEASANPAALKEAADLMAAFARANPNHYRIWQAAEMAAHLLVGLGQEQEAEVFFGRLAEAPWPDVQLRARMAMGRAMLARKNFQEAEKLFDAILAHDQKDERLRHGAAVGKVRVLAATGRTDEAIRLAEETIKAIGAEQVDLQAQAYNALGLAYQKAGRLKEAILAYLHVDLLYSNAPAQHVEALENLVELFGRVGQRERAEEAAKVLQERYGRSAGGS